MPLPFSPQFTPAIRPFLQTISIGLVSFGEHYKRNETGLGECQALPTTPPVPHPTAELPDASPGPQV